MLGTTTSVTDILGFQIYFDLTGWGPFATETEFHLVGVIRSNRRDVLHTDVNLEVHWSNILFRKYTTRTYAMNPLLWSLRRCRFGKKWVASAWLKCSVLDAAPFSTRIKGSMSQAFPSEAKQLLPTNFYIRIKLFTGHLFTTSHHNELWFQKVALSRLSHDCLIFLPPKISI